MVNNNEYCKIKSKEGIFEVNITFNDLVILMRSHINNENSMHLSSLHNGSLVSILLENIIWIKRITPMTGMELIKQERLRQINELGYTPDKDQKYNSNNELFMAACCYFAALRMRAINKDCPGFTTFDMPNGWPWDAEFWKPSPDNRIRECVKAGALYMAHFDLNSTHERNDIDFVKLCASEIDQILLKEKESKQS